MGSGAAEFMKAFAGAMVREREAIDRACSRLREAGFSAAHPDDGWVEREEGRLVLAYPYFQASEVVAGSRVALGDPSRGFREVEVTGVRDTMFGIRHYHFRDRGPISAISPP